MKITSVAAALLGAAIIGSAPAVALAADTSVSPIHLDNVEIERSYGAEHQLFPGIVHVSFTNAAPVAVTEVDFALEHTDGSFIRSYHDVGPFAPGESVKHNFSDIHIAENQKLVVDTVKFADGTSWSAPDTSPDIKPMSTKQLQ